MAKNSFSPCSPCSPWLKNHAGFVLPSAIFLLVVLASLAAFLVSISQTQNVTLAQNVQGSRAYEAARAGVEWGLFRVFAETPPVCDSTASKTIEGFAVTIECTAYPNATDFYMENGNKLRVYRLISTASNGTPGAMGFVERQIQATIARPDL
ncbi:MAG: hypothetical protein LBS70_04495 [Candidatus Accumulibacter sp.]|nr:hypothetical protein [Accumulibacter sp.]